jgi:hypothetical protein
MHRAGVLHRFLALDRSGCDVRSPRLVRVGTRLSLKAVQAVLGAEPERAPRMIESRPVALWIDLHAAHGSVTDWVDVGGCAWVFAASFMILTIPPGGTLLLGV